MTTRKKVSQNVMQAIFGAWHFRIIARKWQNFLLTHQLFSMKMVQLMSELRKSFWSSKQWILNTLYLFYCYTLFTLCIHRNTTPAIFMSKLQKWKENKKSAMVIPDAEEQGSISLCYIVDFFFSCGLIIIKYITLYYKTEISDNDEMELTPKNVCIYSIWNWINDIYVFIKKFSWL